MKTWAAVLLVASMVLAGCTSNDSSTSDADEDGLTDAQERAGWDIIVDLVGKRISRHVDSDPNKQDTDGDGVLDSFEYALSLDPRSKDTDEDGLTDCEEVYHSVREECEDTQWEGQTDGGLGTIGNNADSDAFPSRYVRFTLGYEDETGTVPATINWGDGIPDGEEIHGYNVTVGSSTRWVVTDPLQVDSDGDYLEDGEERFLYGSDPTVLDSDGDSCVDGLDPWPDAEERFDIGLQSVTWAPDGASGSAEIQLLLHVADNGFNLPPASGLQVEHGAPRDLSGEETPIVGQAHCSFPPWHPWVQVSVQAREIVDGDPGMGLDLSSDDVPNDLGLVWWNVRDGRFHFDAERRETTDEAQAFTVPGGVLEWSGPDGSVAFAPALVKRDNQNP